MAVYNYVAKDNATNNRMSMATIDHKKPKKKARTLILFKIAGLRWTTLDCAKLSLGAKAGIQQVYNYRKKLLKINMIFTVWLLVWLKSNVTLFVTSLLSRYRRDQPVHNKPALPLWQLLAGQRYGIELATQKSIELAT